MLTPFANKSNEVYSRLGFVATGISVEDGIKSHDGFSVLYLNACVIETVVWEFFL